MDLLTQHTVDAGAGVDAVASFENVAVLAPRGRFEIEMYLTFLKLIGQVNPSCKLLCNPPLHAGAFSTLRTSFSTCTPQSLTHVLQPYDPRNHRFHTWGDVILVW